MQKLYTVDSECCGCSACEAVCPVNIIKMEINEEGFFYPNIYNEKNCIQCGLCKKVCPMKRKDISQNFSKQIFAAVSNNQDIWESSSSGGIFTEICQSLKIENPVIFGASWDGLNVIMDYSDGLDDICKFRKSKYVIANPNGMFQKVKEYLNLGRFVIFSGTPCQINGLNLFLNKKSEKLLTIDFACHGQGSKIIFDKWIEYLERTNKRKVIGFSFREKRRLKDHINSNCCSYVLENGDKIIENRDYYHHAYVNGLCMRKSCADCQFANHRLSDITLADFKNLKNGLPDYEEIRNVSTVIANTDKGKMVINKLNNISKFEVDGEFVYRYNPKLVKGLPGNPQRDNFMNDVIVLNKDVSKTIKRYAKISLKEKVEYNCSTKVYRILAPVMGVFDKIINKLKR